jgi:chaperone modulatory protein CbpM
MSMIVIHGTVVEEEVRFSLLELSRACGASIDLLITLVDEGVLAPVGRDASHWHFTVTALRRARAALRLTRDLDLNVAGVALVLDLLDEIDALESQRRRTGRP